jgi:hypothetical protein
MNKNTERYQRSFQKLHLSEDFPERVEAQLGKERKDKDMKISTFARAAAAIGACVVTLGAGGLCYAADVCGIRTQVGVWLNGQKVTVEADSEERGPFNWEDANGNTVAYGGNTFDENGNEMWMNAEELAEVINNDPSLRKVGDRAMLYYKNLSFDVTDQIREDGTMYVHIEDPLNPYTYINFDEIAEDHYSGWTDEVPEEGIEYYELDAAGLTPEGTPAPKRQEGEIRAFCVTAGK